MSDNPNNWKNPGIKIPYLTIEGKPIVEGTRCVEVRIPDDDSYMPVLAGLVGLATKWFNWQRDPTHKGAELAKIWQNAYRETDWSPCMNCEELTACIQPLLDAQTQQITNNILNQIQYGTQNPGQPMSGEQSAANIAEGTNPTCDLDILWAQCLAVIQFTNRAIVDVLEQVEAAANVVELVGLADEIPLIGYILDFIGVDLSTQTINYYQEAILEGYQAQYTETVEQELACQLFCLARNDCGISVDLLFDMFAGNLGSLLPHVPGDLIDLLEIFAGIDFDGTEVVDVCMFFAWATGKLAQFFFGQSLANTALQQLVQLAVDDASADWQTLCLNCPGCYFWNFDTGESDWDLLYGQYGPGPLDRNAFHASVEGAETFMRIQYDFATPTNISFIELDTVHADMWVTIQTDVGDIVLENYRPALGGAEDIFSYPASIEGASWLKIIFRRDVPDSDMWLFSVKINYGGDLPTGGEAC